MCSHTNTHDNVQNNYIICRVTQLETKAYLKVNIKSQVSRHILLLSHTEKTLANNSQMNQTFHEVPVADFIDQSDNLHIKG